jgi:hypothetical protein
MSGRRCQCGHLLASHDGYGCRMCDAVWLDVGPLCRPDAQPLHLIDAWWGELVAWPNVDLPGAYRRGRDY